MKRPDEIKSIIRPRKARYACYLGDLMRTITCISTYHIRSF